MSNVAIVKTLKVLTFSIISVFDSFETLVTFAAVIIVNYAIGDARTHWLEGLILIVIYVLIGLSMWYALFNPSFTRVLLTEFQVLPRHLICRIRWTEDNQYRHSNAATIGTVIHTPRLGLGECG